MREIEPKIKPLYRDLQELNIGSYLASVDFDRHCVKHGMEELWQNAIDAYKKENPFFLMDSNRIKNEKENAFRIILNWSFRSSTSDFNSIVFIVLIGFIESLNRIQNIDNIFEDLVIINYPPEKIGDLKKIHEENQKQIDMIQSAKKTNSVTTEEKINQNTFIESKKTAWIEMIAKADVQGALDDIKLYVSDNKLLGLLKIIVNLSSRWNRINKSDNHGVIRLDEKNIEINKINEALVDLIMGIK